MASRQPGLRHRPGASDLPDRRSNTPGPVLSRHRRVADDLRWDGLRAIADRHDRRRRAGSAAAGVLGVLSSPWRPYIAPMVVDGDPSRVMHRPVGGGEVDDAGRLGDRAGDPTGPLPVALPPPVPRPPAAAR